MLKPTIGRVIWFHPAKTDPFIKTKDEQPVPALVCCVHSDDCINVGGFDAHGDHFSRQDVPLIQDGTPPPENEHYAEWMPYQIKQAGTPPEPETNTSGDGTVAAVVEALPDESPVTPKKSAKKTA